MIWLLIGLAFADCAEQGAEAATAHAVALERAYLALHEDEFAREHLAMMEALGCAAVPLSEVQVVAIHEAKALAAFVDGELAASRKSWAAVRQLDPDFEPDPALMPPGHPLRAQFEEAVPDDERVELERSPAGGWRVDSEPVSNVPKNRAFLLQGFDLAGAVVHSGYHYSVAEVPQVDFAELDETARQKRRRRMHWIGSIASGGLAVGSLTTLALAASAEAEVNSPDTGLGGLEPAATQANSMSYASLALIGGAVSVGTVTWVVRW